MFLKLLKEIEGRDEEWSVSFMHLSALNAKIKNENALKPPKIATSRFFIIFLSTGLHTDTIRFVLLLVAFFQMRLTEMKAIHWVFCTLAFPPLSNSFIWSGFDCWTKDSCESEVTARKTKFLVSLKHWSLSCQGYLAMSHFVYKEGSCSKFLSFVKF